MYANDAEAAFRFGIFQESLTKIDELNEARTPGSATFAINKFADRTQTERRLPSSSRLSHKFGKFGRGRAATDQWEQLDEPSGSTNSAFQTRQLDHIAALPAQFDYRSIPGALSTPWDQWVPNFCGNCYAIGAAACLESQVWLASDRTQPLQRLSISQATNCHPDFPDAGCENGGEFEDVWQYYLQYGAIPQSVYPYDNGDGSTHNCTYDPTKVRMRVRALANFPSPFPFPLSPFALLPFYFLRFRYSLRSPNVARMFAPMWTFT